ncbi:MAG TPA: peptidoglycan DD-metalloendopeptidase family protein [Candidatus Paceibacterota bacterium]
MKRVFSCLLVAVLFAPLGALAQAPADLQREIDANSQKIAELNKEIEQYQAQLDTTTKQKNTLQNKVSQLDLQRKKLTASVNVTKNQISSTQLQIRQLESGIEVKQGTIESQTFALGESLRNLSRAENRPLAVTLLSSETITDAWQDADSLMTIQQAVRDNIAELSAEKRSLTETKVTAEGKQKELVRQQATLVTQQGSLDATRKAQNELLQQTKSQESTYQAILREKQAAKASFEAALLDLQSQFRRTLDPSEIPSAGKGILRWPLDNVRVTQYFGNTAFAAAGAYNGRGHNGIDLAASIGTPIRASLSGLVVGSGNTDSVRGCYSFGKWVMIRHNNGLSTMYSHLSQINVSEGQGVATGQILGYSGDTGYATGPHLHYGVYVTAVTEIVALGSATNRTSPCSSVKMPVPRDQSGYLNPLNYLP